MKVCILTNSLRAQDGWGRYSRDLQDALEKVGVQTRVVKMPQPLDYRINFILAPYFAWRLRKEVKECDVVHVFVEPYAYIAYWLSKFTKKKYFITAHGTFGILPYTLGGFRKYCHNQAFKNAEKIICVSDYTRKRLAEYGLKNLTTICNGINFSRFVDDLSKDESNYILSVGVLKSRKGYHISIPAFAKVREKVPELKYYIVGDQSDQEYYAKLMKIISQLGIVDHVKFIAGISDQEMREIYSKARLFVLTPVSEGAGFEGFGLVYLEAGANNLPVIGSRDSGAEDAIQDGVTGLLVDQNAEDLSGALEKLLENPTLRQSMGKAGRDWARSQDWGIVVNNYLKIYG